MADQADQDEARATNPQAIEARNRLYEPPSEAARREAAARLLKLILGSQERAPLPALPRGVDRLSPAQQGAWMTLRESWPDAVGRIRQAGAITGGSVPPSAIGAFRPGSIAMRDTAPTGQPLSLTTLMEVLAHELSHGMGLRDPRLGDASRPISAYDVQEAAKMMHQDITLPATPRPKVAMLVNGARQLFGPK